jgi:ribose-phosphate pyrophosphokinase
MIKVTNNTYILNLDPGFRPVAINEEIAFTQFKFKGGEPHIRLETEHKYNDAKLVITHRVTSPEALFMLQLAVDAARRVGFKEIALVIPYFPGARQDRVCNEGEPLTIKVYTDIINSLNATEVHILSPHSEVTPALINNVVVHDELEYAEKVIRHIGGHNLKYQEFNIVCPDAGAGKRVMKIIKHLDSVFGNAPYCHQFKLVRCEKTRDVKTGNITDFHVDADDLDSQPTIIFDDILSYGGTFRGLAAKLREKNCGELILFTAHADAIEGIYNMLDVFDFVFTTNSLPRAKVQNEKFVTFDFKINTIQYLKLFKTPDNV